MIVLKLYIQITGVREVKSASRTVRMVFFDGTCSGDWFTGVIEPGGVDTQMDLSDGMSTLSARYMLNGVDCDGRACRMFIENNMTTGEPTRPLIITDSPRLRWLETAELRGMLGEEDGRFVITMEAL